MDLTIPSGQTTVLIGPSGCGKSTILRLMIGLLRPDSGSVTFQDEPLHTLDPSAYRVKMGYVIQDGGLFPHLTARHNIGLRARRAGNSSCHGRF